MQAVKEVSCVQLGLERLTRMLLSACPVGVHTFRTSQVSAASPGEIAVFMCRLGAP